MITFLDVNFYTIYENISIFMVILSAGYSVQNWPPKIICEPSLLLCIDACLQMDICCDSTFQLAAVFPEIFTTACLCHRHHSSL